MLDQWDIYIRSTEGKPVSESEFDTMILPMRLMELAKEYDIRYDKKELIPTDSSLVKDIYEAAIDLLVDLGVYNTSTGRVIRLDEAEIRREMRVHPGEYMSGEGNELKKVVRRDCSDRRMPSIVGGPLGGPVSEKYYLPTMQSYAMESGIDGVFTGTLLSLNGHEIKSKTTSEMLACKREITLTREALRRAGKSGLSITGTMSGVSSECQCFPIAPDGLRGGCDRLLVSMLNELKVDWDGLKKALSCQQNNIGISSCMATMIGGYLGGPETTMIGLTAESIATYLLFGGSAMNVVTPNDVYTSYRSIADNVYVLAGAQAALARNTNALFNCHVVVSSGTGTEQAMREEIAMTGTATVTGAATLLGVTTACTAVPDTYGGMDTRIMIEAADAFLGMSLEEANECIVKLVESYGGMDALSFRPTDPKKFYELYDMKTLRPTNEFEELWKNVKVKAEDEFGLNFSC
ncbi:MAG: monomethylamine:corrinoid methyltransferase [Methanosarcinaceae archaeon]|nr:monomethylamine:corrinoid methyltransferase [Methanosarcinaceae archaeon]